MKGEFVTKEYLREALDSQTDKITDMMMEGFSHFNIKFETRIDELEKRLDNKIDSIHDKLDNKIDFRFNQLSSRIDDLAETKVSRPEFATLKGRVRTLETTHQTS